MTAALITLLASPLIAFTVFAAYRWGQRDPEKWRAWWYILGTFLAYLFLWLLYPALVHVNGYAPFPAAVLSLLPVGASLVAYARCPFRQWFAKSIAFLLFLVTAYAAVLIVGSHFILRHR